MGLLQGPFSSPIIPQRAAIDGLLPSSEQPSNAIPLRKFGRHDVKVSALEEGLRYAMRLPVATTISGRFPLRLSLRVSKPDSLPLKRVRLRLGERPTGDGLREVFCVFVLTEHRLRRHTKDDASRGLQQRPKITAIFAIINLNQLLPGGAVRYGFGGPFEDYGFIGFFGPYNAATILNEISRFARPRSSAEPKRVLPPDAPDHH